MSTRFVPGNWKPFPIHYTIGNYEHCDGTGLSLGRDGVGAMSTSLIRNRPLPRIKEPRHRPTVESQEKAFSYERGAPVGRYEVGATIVPPKQGDQAVLGIKGECGGTSLTKQKPT